MAKAKRKGVKRVKGLGKSITLRKDEIWAFWDRNMETFLKYNTRNRTLKLVLGPNDWMLKPQLKRLIYFLKKVQKKIGG